MGSLVNILRFFLLLLWVGGTFGCRESVVSQTPPRNLVVNLMILPQAYTGGGFSFPPTQAETYVPCRQGGVEKLAMIVDAPSFFEPLRYDLSSLLDSDCQGGVILPEEEHLYFRLEGFDRNGELVREGFAEFSVTSETNEILFLLWKSRRVIPPASKAPESLNAVDIVSASDGRRIVLHFSRTVTPPSRQQEEELSPWLFLFRFEGGDLCCSLAFSDPREDGFPLQSFSGTPTRRLPFRFIGRDLHIFLEPSLFPGGKLPQRGAFSKVGEDLGALLEESQSFRWFPLE
jgi:hypothetical protein